MSLIKTNSKPLWLFVFLVIYISDDSLLFGTNQNEVLIFSKYIFYTLFNTYFFINSIDRNVSKKDFTIILFIFLLLVALLLSSFYNSDLRNGTFLFIYTLITASFFVSKYSFVEFGRTYIKMLYYFSLFALTTYVINLVLPSVFSIFPTIINSGGVQFKFLIFGNVFDGFNFTRNLSVFREPGIYAFHLCISLVLQLLAKDQFINRKVLIFTLLALLSTLSTTGILVFGLIMLIYNLKNRKIRSFVYTSVLLIGIFAVVLTKPELFSSIFSKFDSSSSDYSSSLSRTSSFYVNLEIIKSHWFFGVGLTSFVDLYPLESLKLYGIMLSADAAATNTLLNILSVYGIWPFLLVTYAIYSLSKIIDRKFALLIFIILLLLLSSQEIRYSLLFSVLVAYGVSDISKYQTK